MSACKNLIGTRFNRLTVIERLENNKHKKAMWLCQCDCGNTIIVCSGDLKNNHTRSCGCFRDEQCSKLANTHLLKHGKRNTRLYNIWEKLRKRCNNPKDKAFNNYGGRGIIVCDEWNNNFLSFYNWSMNNGYADNLSLDRIDNNGNYEPSNCRWVTSIIQANNRRNNKLVTINNETHTVAEWGRIMNIPYSKIYYQLTKKEH